MAEADHSKNETLTNVDKVIRALAVHASFTSTMWLDVTPSERIESFEKLMHAYATGSISRSAFDALARSQGQVGSGHGG